jgi:PhnB protein
MKMKDVNVYLVFDGNAREAFEFYKSCFGGELFAMKFSDSPMPGDKQAAGAGDRMMHIALKNGPAVLMASDTMPGMPFKAGNNFNVSISCGTNDEVDRYFAAVSKGGKAHMQPQETFWAHRFAACQDKFGINWMFNHEKPMQASA